MMLKRATLALFVLGLAICPAFAQDENLVDGFKIPDPIGGKPLLESRGSYFGLRIP